MCRVAIEPAGKRDRSYTARTPIPPRIVRLLTEIDLDDLDHLAAQSQPPRDAQ